MATEAENRDSRRVNREAEKSIISCMLQDQDTIVSAVEGLTGEEFSVEIYKKIYDAINDLSKRDSAPNIVMVRDYLISKGEKGDIVDMNFLSDIAVFTLNPKEINTFIEIVKEKYIIRRTMDACNTINVECINSDASVRQILDEAQEKFFKLAEEKGQKEYVKLSKVFSNVLINIGEAAKSEDGVTGIRTKFDKLDKCTSGFQKSDLIILAARPGVGKTSFALNLANKIAKGGYKVAFFSLEMSKEQLAMRILATETGLSSKKLRSGRVNDKDMQNLITTAGMIADEEGYIIVDESSNITIAELRSKCRKIKKESGLDIIFIDYLQLMHAGNVTKDSSFAKYINNRQEEVAEISRSLKSLAKELNIPIVALAQTRRPSDTSDKKDKRPQLEDLKESGAIEQDADIVMFLHRPHKDDPEAGNIEEMQLIIEKHRNGETGTISFRFDKSITRFDEFDKRQDYIVPPNTSQSTNQDNEQGKE